MTEKTDSSLEDLIGWVLIVGVVSSVVFDVVGLAKTGSWSLTLSPTWLVQSPNFFSFIGSTLSSLGSATIAYNLIAIGIILLMITPYVRVVVSVLYYAVTKDFRYVGITLLVLAIITASLLAL